MSERDELEDFLREWKGLDAPDPTPEDADAELEAGLAELRAAWRALEAPPVRVPLGLRLRVLRAGAPALTRLAAAALLVLASALALGVLLGGDGAMRRGEQTSARLDAPLPEVVSTGETPATQENAPPRRDAQPRVVDTAANETGIVMAHGSVRLVMLEPVLDEVEGSTDMENDR